MNRRAAYGLLVAALLGLAGCSTMSGLDAKSSFACKAPEGVLCESMAGVYANAQQHNLPGQQGRHKAANAQPTLLASGNPGILPAPLDSGTPIRTAPRILRVWLAPWEDSDGDLHDQSYVYLTLDTGNWRIDHHRQRIRDQFRPVRPSAAATTGPGPSSTILPGAVPPTTEAIGQMQERPSAVDSAALLNGIATPAALPGAIPAGQRPGD